MSIIKIVRTHHRHVQRGIFNIERCVWFLTLFFFFFFASEVKEKMSLYIIYYLYWNLY